MALALRRVKTVIKRAEKSAASLGGINNPTLRSIVGRAVSRDQSRLYTAGFD